MFRLIQVIQALRGHVTWLTKQVLGLISRKRRDVESVTINVNSVRVWRSVTADCTATWNVSRNAVDLPMESYIAATVAAI